MPVTFDSRGRASYTSKRIVYSAERPENFLRSDVYEVRIAEARRRILEAIRFAERPLAGAGMNHEMEHVGDKRRVEYLTDLIDQYDRRRYDRLNKQRSRERRFGLAPFENRIRSPQDIKRRRSALFSGADIPEGHFTNPSLSKPEIRRFVDLMRWYTINDAVWGMYAENELVYMNSTWYVSVTVMDLHRKPRLDRANRVKRDDRSNHGAVGTRRSESRAVRHEQGTLAKRGS